MAAVAPADLWFADGGACRTFRLIDLVNVTATDGGGGGGGSVPFFVRLDTCFDDDGRCAGAVYVWPDVQRWADDSFFGVANVSVTAGGTGDGAVEVRATIELLYAYGPDLRITFCPSCSESWYVLRASLADAGTSTLLHAGPPPRSAILGDDDGYGFGGGSGGGGGGGGGGHVIFRIYEADMRRLTVRGHVHAAPSAVADADLDGVADASPPCATPAAVAATVRGAYSYAPNPLGLAAAGTTCERRYSAEVDASAGAGATADGSFAFGLSVPSYTADTAPPSTLPLSVTFANGSAYAHAGVTQHLSLHVSHDVPPGGTPPERWLGTAYAEHVSRAASAAVGGQLYAIVPEHEYVLRANELWEGTVVSLTEGMDVPYGGSAACDEFGEVVVATTTATTTTSADGGGGGDGDDDGALTVTSSDEEAASGAAASGEPPPPPPSTPPPPPSTPPPSVPPPPAAAIVHCALSDARGNFTFDGVAPGMYTLRVESLGEAAAALYGGMSVAPLALTIRTSEALDGASSLQLGALLLTAADEWHGTTRALLRWRTARARLALKGVFPYEPPCYEAARATCRGAGELCYWEPLCSTPWFDPYGGFGCNAGNAAYNCRWCGFDSYPPCPTTGDDDDAASSAAYATANEAICEVFEGRPACAETAWAAQVGTSSFTAQYLEFAAWAVANYSVFAVSQEARLCSGYGLPSSASLPGGGAAYVDCIGNCATGRGYCYASGDLCANCVLWGADADAGEVLCYAAGEEGARGAQGGPLPGTAEWDDDSDGDGGGCADVSLALAAASNVSSGDGGDGGGGYALPAPAPLAAGCGRLEGELQLVSGAAQVGPTVHLPWWQPSHGVVGSRALCLHLAAEPPTVSYPNRPLTDAEYVAWRDDLVAPSPCHEPSCAAAGPWTLHWSARPWAPAASTPKDSLLPATCALWRARWEAAVGAAPATDAPAGACDAHLPHAEGVSSLSACGVAAPPATGVVSRLSLTFSTGASGVDADGDAPAPLLLALSSRADAGCAAINGVDVPWSAAVGGWLVLAPTAGFSGTQHLEWFGYSFGGSSAAATASAAAAAPSVSLRYTRDASVVAAFEAAPEGGVAEADLVPIGEGQLCA